MAREVRIRTFLALPLAPHFQTELDVLVTQLRRDYPEVRWVCPSEIHVTLHFFGSVTQKEVTKISRTVSSLSEKTNPFELFLEGLGAFPNLKQPRVIWIGIKGESEKLKRLHLQLEQELHRAGFPCEEREFKPHLTLGRIKDTQKFGGIRPVRFGPSETKKMSGLVLFQTHLTPQGSHYETIAAYPFSPS
jgi:2'-5' RNA ligase